MQLKKFKILFILLSFTACNSGPKVDVCISDPKNNGFQCVDKNQKKYFLKYQDSDNYVAFSSEDARTLLTYCGMKPSEIAELERYYALK